MTRLRLFVTATIVAAVVAFLNPVQAQTYSSWEDPDARASREADQAAAAERLQAFITQLRTILDQAEKDRAANPRLLDDLNALADTYDRPWSVVALSDDFSDGDFETNPAWTVLNGRYWIEKDWGLRNELKTRTVSGDDAAKQLLGQILTEALGGQTSSRAAGAEPTAIYANADISNAFSATVEFSSWVNEGVLLLGPWQGLRDRPGYRIVYQVGGAIELVTVTSRGVRVVASAPGPFKLEDKAVHKLTWDRYEDGEMVVMLDNTEIIRVTDQSFRDPFRMWGFATNGGDFIIGKVTVTSGP